MAKSFESGKYKKVDRKVEASPFSKELIRAIEEMIVVGQNEILESLVISKHIWKEDDPEYNRPKEYLQTLLDLKRKIGVEGVRMLNRNFGIIHFDRYGVERMAAQYDYFLYTRNTGERKPFFASIFAYSDYNDAFLKRVSLGELEEFAEQNKTTVIYSECGNPRQCFKNLLFSRRNLGLMSAVTISGHGSTNNVNLGRKPMYVNDELTPGDEVKFYDIDFNAVFALSKIDTDKFLTKNAFVIIDACDTAATPSVPHYLSLKIKRPVFACGDLVAFYKIYGYENFAVRDDEDKIVQSFKLPKVVFFDEEDNPHETVVFKNGENFYYRPTEKLK